MDSKPAKRRYTSNGQYFEMIERTVKKAGERVAFADPDDLARLEGIHDFVECAIATAISGLRQAGFTWESIGEALGTTRQAAQQRYGKLVREA